MLHLFVKTDENVREILDYGILVNCFDCLEEPNKHTLFKVDIWYN